MNLLQHLSLAVTLFSHYVFAHMEMSLPFPINSRYDPKADASLIDYNLKSPLDSSGSNYPCRGYQNQRPIRTTASYVAGQSYGMTIAGSATHGGGSCQLSLSYDNGGTFKVIKSMIGGCPLTQSYTFTIPAFAPSGNALFAWTWFNEIGNREMYMNCAWVQISNPVKSRRSAARRAPSRRADTFTSMQSLPNIWRANIDGISTCGTVEGTDPVFANPGPDVVYGSGKNANSPITNPNGNCDSAVPAGRTFQAMGDTGSVLGSSSSSISLPLSSSLPSTSASAANTPSNDPTNQGNSVSTPSTFSISSSIQSTVVPQVSVTTTSTVSPSSSFTSTSLSSLPSSVVASSASSASASLFTSSSVPTSSRPSTSSSISTPTPSSNVGGIFAPGAASSPFGASLSTTPNSLTVTSSTVSTISSPSISGPSLGYSDHTTSTIRITSTTTSTVTVELVSTALSSGNSTTSLKTALTITIATNPVSSSAPWTNSSRPLELPSLSTTLRLTSAVTTGSAGNSSLPTQGPASSLTSQLLTASSINSSSTAPNTSISRSGVTSVAISSTSISTSASQPTSSIITIPDPSPESISFTNLDFATPQNQSLYLPCVPGTLLCMSQFSFVICDQGPWTPSMRPSQVFKGPINVAAGMQCVPFLQKFVSSDTAGRFGGSAGAAPEGMYRSDRYLGLY